MARCSNLDARRTELASAEAKAVAQRQALERAKVMERQRFLASNEEKKREADATSAEHRAQLRALEVAKNQGRACLASARGQAQRSADVADRSLAIAGQKALATKAGADKQTARLAQEEQRHRSVRTEQEAKLDRLRHLLGCRVSEVAKRCEARKDVAQRLLEEQTQNCEQIRQRFSEQMKSDVAHAERHAFIKSDPNQMNVATAELNRCGARSADIQRNCLAELHKARQDAAERMAQAQAALEDRQRQCEAELSQQRICEAQARRIACTLVEQEDAAARVAVDSMGVQLGRYANMQQQRIGGFVEEVDLACARQQGADDAVKASTLAAQLRVEEEAGLAAARLTEAKVMFHELQLRCAEYLRSLSSQLEEVRRAQAERVAAAVERRDATLRYCERSREDCRRLWESRLALEKQRQERTAARLQERVSEMELLAGERVEMMRLQASEARAQAEKQLLDLQTHIEEVRCMCEARTKEDAAAADERVRIAQARYEERDSTATLRLQEAEARLQQARSVNEQVMARVRGIADEARRRGLDRLADYLCEPMPLPGKVAASEPGARGEVLLAAEAATLKEASDNEDSHDALDSRDCGLLKHFSREEQQGQLGLTGTTAFGSTSPCSASPEEDDALEAAKFEVGGLHGLADA